jgi:nitroimidazol reductase NimA-like FMN-containing flavoprotein (pyridoxamine 5'-phosphate oxidase superfamily)
MIEKPDTRLRRLPERGSSDFASACAIIDEARIGHLGFCLEQMPYVIPMAIGRDGDQVLLHGSVASRAMKHLSTGFSCCLTVTHLDGMVLARSAFNSSMNYRSLMLFGQASPVMEPAEKIRLLDALVEHLLPGRLADLRAPTRKEMNATTLLTLPIRTFSIKSRSGPPADAKADLDAPVWAGVVPLFQTAGAPEPAPDLMQNVSLPGYLEKN